jgi:hypothetical protein
MGLTSRNNKAGVGSRVLKHASGETMSHHSLPRKKHEKNSQRHRTPLYRRQTALLSLLILLITFLGSASAQKLHDRRLQRGSTPLLAVPVENLVAWKEPSLLVLDTRPPPVAPLMHQQRRRDDATTTASASASKETIATDPNAAPSNFKIPTPFDTSLSNNFTASCSKFFQAILTDAEFNDCHPFSLMLQVSVPSLSSLNTKANSCTDLQRILRCLEILRSHYSDPRSHLRIQHDHMSEHNERQGAGTYIEQQLRRGLCKRQSPSSAGIQRAACL